MPDSGDPVDGVQAGGTAEESSAVAPEANPEGTPRESNDTSPDGADWKASSRTWETRAKTNWSDLQTARGDLEKATQLIAELKARLADATSREQVSGWRAEVARDTGLPADVLRGSSLEEMREHAESLKALLRPRPNLNEGRPSSSASALNGDGIEGALKSALGL
jgi:hypothetical protein